jgi:hypothetical protein
VPSPESPVLLFLLQREGPPQERHTAAWQDAFAQDAVAADVRHVWVGEGPVPAGMDLGSLGEVVPVLGVSEETVALVAEAAAVAPTSYDVWSTRCSKRRAAWSTRACSRWS